MSDRVIAGKYVLESKLGSGGMGAVFRARQMALNRPVALKLLKSTETVSQADRSRFQREAKLLTTLRHPNLVSVFDAETEGPEPYIVMELVEGSCLLDVLEHPGDHPRADSGAVALGLADALAYIHEQGVLHRDIKPANILLREGRHPLLADFGLARPESAEALTTEGFMVGTPAYLAPEQFTQGVCNEQTDLYQLGLTLHEFISGKLQFPSRVAVNIQKVILTRIEGDIADLGGLAPDCPPALTQAIMRCLEKDPAKRFKSARELVDALSSAGVGSSTEIPLLGPDRTPAGQERTGRRGHPRGRSSAKLVAAASSPAASPSPPRSHKVTLVVVVVLVAALFGGAMLARRSPEAVPSIAQDASATAAAAPAMAPSPSRGDADHEAQRQLDDLRARGSRLTRTLRDFWTRSELTDQLLVDRLRMLLGTRGLALADRPIALEKLKRYLDIDLRILRPVIEFLPVSPLYFDHPGVPTPERLALYRQFAPLELIDVVAQTYKLPGLPFGKELSTLTGKRFQQVLSPDMTGWRNYCHFFKKTHNQFPRKVELPRGQKSEFSESVVGAQYKMDSRSVLKFVIEDMPIYFSRVPEKYATESLDMKIEVALEEGLPFSLQVRSLRKENSIVTIHYLDSSMIKDKNRRLLAQSVSVFRPTLDDNDIMWSCWFGLK